MTAEMQQRLHARLAALKQELGSVKLLAVSKYAPDDKVEALIRAGQRDFGEARAQQLRDRAGKWPDCRWHMIGPMQKNKAKYVARHAAMWHSCDDLDTARAVAACLDNRTLPVLIQVNIAGNPDQRGVLPEAAAAFVAEAGNIDGLNVAGLMAMGARDAGVRESFANLRSLRDSIFGGSFGELCMGMSGDYKIAIEEGATMVRLGSTLFDDENSVREG